MKYVQKPDHLDIVLAGRLDKKEFDSNQSLAAACEAIGHRALALDMFGLPGVKQRESDPRVYDCDWTPADILRSIKRAIDQNPGSRINLLGFSYSAQMALLYGVLDAGLGLDRVDSIVAIMPTNYYRGENYDADRDLDWMLRQFRETSAIDLATTKTELRTASISHPTVENSFMVNISRQTYASHLMPYNGFLDGNPIPVAVTGLAEAGILHRVNARTLVIAGRHDAFTANASAKTEQIYDALSPGGKDFVLLPIQHDYRDKGEDEGDESKAPNHNQIKIVNTTIADWLLAA